MNESAERVISKIASEQFRARQAYPLNCSENDAGAAHRDDNGVIRFFVATKKTCYSDR